MLPSGTYGGFPPPSGFTDQRSTRRGLALCVAAGVWSALWPGLGHLVIKAPKRAAWVLAALLNIAAVATVVYVVHDVRNKADLIRVIADRHRFIALGFGLVVMAVTRLFTTIDAAWQTRPVRGEGVKAAAMFTTAVFVAVGVVPLAIAADYVRRTDQTLEHVFGNRNATTAGVLFDGLGRVNVLLLGGDAGPNRYSLRTDTMIVVSLDPATGDAAMISVPRNLPTLPFPPDSPMGQRFPNGFTDIANAVYPYVLDHPELGGGGADAAPQVLKQAMAQLMGIPINFYVLVDMAGFVHVVDAIRGIDLYVGTRTPSPGNPDDALHPVPAYIEVGQQHMDGTLALAYSRSREADSDFGRMARQRCVLGAIAAAATPMSLALGLPDLLTAFGASVRTDIPRGKLGDFAALIKRFDNKGGMSSVRTLHLAPPTIDQTAWRLQQVRDLVANVIAPGSVPFIHGDLHHQDSTVPPAAPPSLAQECHASR